MIVTISGCGSSRNNTALANVLHAFLRSQNCPVQVDDAGPAVEPREAALRFKAMARRFLKTGKSAIVETPNVIKMPATRLQAVALLIVADCHKRIVAWSREGDPTAKRINPALLAKRLERNDPRVADAVTYHYHDGFGAPLPDLLKTVTQDFERRAEAAGLQLDFEFHDLSKPVRKLKDAAEWRQYYQDLAQTR